MTSMGRSLWGCLAVNGGPPEESLPQMTSEEGGRRGGEEQRGRTEGGAALLAVELDDELLAHGDVDLLPQRQLAHGHLVATVTGLEPPRRGPVEHIDVVADDDQLASFRA